MKSEAKKASSALAFSVFFATGSLAPFGSGPSLPQSSFHSPFTFLAFISLTQGHEFKSRKSLAFLTLSLYAQRVSHVSSELPSLSSTSRTLIFC